MLSDNVNFQRRRRAFFKMALEEDGNGFVFLPEDLQREERMVWAALDSRTCRNAVPLFLEQLHECFTLDREFMMKLMYKVGAEAIRFASQALRADREFVLRAAKRYGHNVFLWTPRTFTSDAAFLLELAKEHPCAALRAMDGEMWNNRDLVTSIVTKDPLASGHLLTDDFKNDTQLAIACVRVQSSSLYHFTDAVKDDEDVIREAIKKDGCAIAFASHRLQGNEEIMYEAVKQDGQAVLSTFTSYRGNRKIMLEAIKNDPLNLHYTGIGNCVYYHASPAMQQDVEIVMHAIRKSNGYLYVYMTRNKESWMSQSLYLAKVAKELKRLHSDFWVTKDMVRAKYDPKLPKLCGFLLTRHRQQKAAMLRSRVDKWLIDHGLHKWIDAKEEKLKAAEGPILKRQRR